MGESNCRGSAQKTPVLLDITFSRPYFHSLSISLPHNDPRALDRRRRYLFTSDNEMQPREEARLPRMVHIGQRTPLDDFSWLDASRTSSRPPTIPTATAESQVQGGAGINVSCERTPS